MNPSHHPPDISPQVDPVQTLVHASDYFKMYMRKHGAYPPT